jgi:hypothetical protein
MSTKSDSKKHNPKITTPVRGYMSLKKKSARLSSMEEKVGKQLAVPIDGLTPARFLEKMSSTPDLEEETIMTYVSLGRGLFGNAKARLQVSAYLKLVVTSTSHLPQFRVSGNPINGIVAGNGASSVPPIWTYAQLIWDAFFTRKLTARMITNPSVLSSAATDFYLGVLYEGVAADTQSTTLLTAFQAGTSAGNMRLIRGASGGPLARESTWNLTARNPFKYTADSSGWQLTPSTGEIIQISFTTNLATTADNDNYAYVFATWDVSLKHQIASAS